MAIYCVYYNLAIKCKNLTSLCRDSSCSGDRSLTKRKAYFMLSLWDFSWFGDFYLFIWVGVRFLRGLGFFGGRGSIWLGSF